jgi:hypothetical protein
VFSSAAHCITATVVVVVTNGATAVLNDNGGSNCT